MNDVLRFRQSTKNGLAPVVVVTHDDDALGRAILELVRPGADGLHVDDRVDRRPRALAIFPDVLGQNLNRRQVLLDDARVQLLFVERELDGLLVLFDDLTDVIEQHRDERLFETFAEREGIDDIVRRERLTVVSADVVIGQFARWRARRPVVHRSAPLAEARTCSSRERRRWHR